MAQALRLGIFSANVVAALGGGARRLRRPRARRRADPRGVLAGAVRVADGRRVRRRPHLAGQRRDLRAQRVAIRWAGGSTCRSSGRSTAAAGSRWSGVRASSGSTDLGRWPVRRRRPDLRLRLRRLRPAPPRRPRGRPRRRSRHGRRHPAPAACCSPTGEFDATLLNAGHEARAARAGAHVLGEVSDVVAPVPRHGAGHPRRRRHPRRAGAAGCLGRGRARRRCARAAGTTSWPCSAAQPDTDRAIAEQMYATLLDPVHGLCVGGEVDPAALEAVLRLRADAGRLRAASTTSPRSPGRAAGSCGPGCGHDRDPAVVAPDLPRAHLRALQGVNTVSSLDRSAVAPMLLVIAADLHTSVGRGDRRREPLLPDLRPAAAGLGRRLGAAGHRADAAGRPARRPPWPGCCRPCRRASGRWPCCAASPVASSAAPCRRRSSTSARPFRSNAASSRSPTSWPASPSAWRWPPWPPAGRRSCSPGG